MSATALGDCYEASGRFITDAEDGYLLCHGTVTGTGGEVLGIDYGHAWIEHGDEVIDVSNGRTVRIPAIFYYKLGNVRNVVRYTPAEARLAMIEHEHYGPWEGFKCAWEHKNGPDAKRCQAQCEHCRLTMPQNKKAPAE